MKGFQCFLPHHVKSVKSSKCCHDGAVLVVLVWRAHQQGALQACFQGPGEHTKTPGGWANSASRSGGDKLCCCETQTSWCRWLRRRWSAWHRRSRGWQARWRRTPAGCQGDQGPSAPPPRPAGRCPPGETHRGGGRSPPDRKPCQQKQLEVTN